MSRVKQDCVRKNLTFGNGDENYYFYSYFHLSYVNTTFCLYTITLIKENGVFYTTLPTYKS